MRVFSTRILAKSWKNLYIFTWLTETLILVTLPFRKIRKNLEKSVKSFCLVGGVKLKIPKKPGPQKSLQEVAAARATENLRRDKKGKVREQVDLFVVAQKAQVVLCYHKRGDKKKTYD